MGEDLFKCAVFSEKLDGGFFADPRYARDMVAGITHQTLEIRDLLGRYAEIGKDLGRRIPHNIGHALFRKEDICRIRNQLQGIPVAGHEKAGNAALLTLGRNGSEDVIRFEGRTGQNRNLHGLETILKQRKLRAELRRCRAPAGLILGVLLMAERGPVQVERDKKPLRTLLFGDTKHHIQKPEYGVCVNSIGSCEKGKRVKSPMHQAVAVDYDVRGIVLQGGNLPSGTRSSYHIFAGITTTWMHANTVNAGVILHLRSSCKNPKSAGKKQWQRDTFSVGFAGERSIFLMFIR